MFFRSLDRFKKVIAIVVPKFCHLLFQAKLIDRGSMRAVNRSINTRYQCNDVNSPVAGSNKHPA